MRIKTWQYIVIGLLVLGAVGLIALGAWLRPYDLKTERAAARAAGLPVSRAEFVRPKPPTEKDAGPEWLALTVYLEKHPLDTTPIDRLAGRGGTLPPSAMPMARRVLLGRPDVLSRIHSAAAKPDAYFEQEFAATAINPYYVSMRTAVRVLRWESAMLAHQGRYAEAVRTMELGLNISDQMDSEPIIGMLVSLAVNAISTAGMEDILHAAGPDPRVAALVEQAVRRHPVRTSLARSMKGEVMLGATTIRNLPMVPSSSGPTGPSGGPGGSSPPQRASFPVRHYYIEPTEAAYLHWMRRLYGAAQYPLPERRAELKKVTLTAEAKGRSHSAVMAMTSPLMPVFAKADDRNTMMVARHAVVIAAARVLAWRGRTGRWPSSLSEAAPNLPMDPFSGKPLVYRVEGKGFVIYSAGTDGRFTASPGQPEKDQTFFRYPRATVTAGPIAPATPMPGGPPMSGTAL